MAYNPSTNIVVSGKTFMDVPAVQFKTPDGATVNFAHVGGSIRFSPTLEEQTNNVENFSNAIIDPITSTLLNQLDSDFVAGNIKNGVDLFGLMGTMESGSNIRVETGTVTFAEDTSRYDFVSDNPDILFVHLEFPEPTESTKLELTYYSYKTGGCDTPYIFSFIQFPKTWNYYNSTRNKIEYAIGYCKGTRIIYALTVTEPYSIGSGPHVNTSLGAGKTYRYWAIYGVTVE